MITEISIPSVETYSCQHCGKQVDTSKSYSILQNFSPCCSYKCFFNVVYNFLKIQGLSYNVIFFSLLNPYTSLVYEIETPQSQEKELIFDNAKIGTKKILSSVKGGLSLYQSLIIS